MKRAASALLLATALAAGALPCNAAEAPFAYTLKMPQYLAAPGTATAQLFIAGDPGTAGMELRLTADAPLQLTAGGFANPYCYGSGTPSGGMGTGFSAESGKLLWFTANNGADEIVFDETLPFAKFQLTAPAGAATGACTFAIDAAESVVGNADGAALTPQFVPATVTLVTRGDVNMDSVVNAADACLILRDFAAEMLHQPSALGAAAQTAADTDDSGTRDAADAVRVLRYYAASLLGTADWNTI